MRMWFFFICCRSISLILKFSPRGRWHLMTAAAVSVARSAILWKTAPCAKSRDALVVWNPVHVCNYPTHPTHPDLEPSRGGTRRDGPNTSERGRTWETTVKNQPGRKTSTGGRETHQRSAAASCVGQAPTSRGTVSWTETLQVADVNAVNEWRGMNLLCLISDFHLTGNMKMETFSSSSSTPAHLRNLREPDRQVHSHVQLRCHVYISAVFAVFTHLLCFGVFSCLHIKTSVFIFFPESTFTRREKKEEATKSDIRSGNRYVLSSKSAFNRLKV